MNHFMLPEGESSSFNPASYGVHAMELLINECMKLGGDRRRFEAKIFGGAKMFDIASAATRVAERNIEFALGFLQDENIPVVSQDLGGKTGRELFFYTQTGRVRLKRLEDRHRKQLIDSEAKFTQVARPKVEAVETDITLF
jgi:chemotaxis receptor (MCP) glutamine deamidase CheD